MNHVTIIQQGTSPKVVEAEATLRETLEREGIDLDGFSVLKGGQPAELDSGINASLTVTVTKKSVGA